MVLIKKDISNASPTVLSLFRRTLVTMYLTASSSRAVRYRQVCCRAGLNSSADEGGWRGGAQGGMNIWWYERAWWLRSVYPVLSHCRCKDPCCQRLHNMKDGISCYDCATSSSNCSTIHPLEWTSHEILVGTMHMIETFGRSTKRADQKYKEKVYENLCLWAGPYCSQKLLTLLGSFVSSHSWV